MDGLGRVDVPRRVWMSGFVCVFIGLFSIWQLSSAVMRHGIEWNWAALLLPIGVVCVLVKRTSLMPSGQPKWRLVLGVFATLIGFFVMSENFSALSREGETIFPGAIFIPLGIGLVLGRPFCRAMIRVLLVIGIFLGGVGAMGYEENFRVEQAADSSGTLWFYLVSGAMLLVMERVLYSGCCNDFFMRTRPAEIELK